MKKNLIFILTLFMIFGIVSCNFDENSSTNQNQTENPDPQEEKKDEEPEEEEQGEPTVPKIASGYYMAGDWKNLVILVYNNQVLIREYKDVDAFNRADNIDGDVISSSEISTTLVWYASGISAYKIPYKGNIYYLFEKDGKIKVDKTNENVESDVKTLREIPLEADKRTNWLKPDDGIYVSASKAPFGEKTYMYAKVENGATKITLYYNESNTLKDVSTLTVSATIDNISYNFVPTQLEYQNDDWTVSVHNKEFRIKPANTTLAAISFTKISNE